MTSQLFTPYTMRGVTLPHRIVVSPMCQYNSEDGSANDWHLMHLGQFSLGTGALVMTESTHVSMVGRISLKCAAIPANRSRPFTRPRAPSPPVLSYHYAGAGRRPSACAAWSTTSSSCRATRPAASTTR